MDGAERESIGPLIRVARKAQGMTLEQLETASGITRRTISDTERGVRTAHPETIRALLAALGVPVLDADVTSFLSLLGPLLQKLSLEEREEVMPAVVRLVAEALRPVQESTVADLQAMAEKRRRRYEPPDAAELSEAPESLVAKRSPEAAGASEDQ